MIDSTTRDALHREWEHCMTSPRHEKEPKPFHKFNPPDDCAMMEGVLLAAGSSGVYPRMPDGPNTYDVTTWGTYDVLLGHDNSVSYFFNDPRVKKKLHAPEHIEWSGCIPGAGRRRTRRLSEEHRQEGEEDDDEGTDEASTTVRSGTRNLMLDDDRPISTVPYIAELLDDADVRVLIYNGDRDLSTCAQGSEMYLNQMDWNGSDGWPTAPRGLWVSPDSLEQTESVAGYSKEHLGLSFVVVYNSGHLVPFSVPAPALDLITRFLQNKSFSDYELPTITAPPAKGGKDATASYYGAGESVVGGAGGRHMSKYSHSFAIFFVAMVSFVLGFFASNYAKNKRSEYEAIGNGDCELEETT